MHKSLLLLCTCILGVSLATPRDRRQAGFNPDAGFIEACECVPYYQCQDGEIITDGTGLIDIRVGNRSAPVGAASPAVSTQCELFLDVCCRVPNVGPIEPEIPKYTAGCGRRNEEGVHARISGFEGNEAQFGEFPWMTAILRTEYIGDKEVNLYVCGGSLIADNVVLTAAHCVAGKDTAKLRIRAGEWDTQNDYELYAHEDREVIEYLVHPEYNQLNLHNDFALVFLKTPFTLQPHIDTICLPGPQQLPEGTTCFATGWGKDKFGKEGVYQNVLKRIALPTVSKNNCQDRLRSTRLGKHFKLDHSFMCAGGIPGQDTCTGDGGSPLVCQLPGDGYIQVGIVAWGIGCGENGIPGVYADVTQVGNWIEDEIINRSIIL